MRSARSAVNPYMVGKVKCMCPLVKMARRVASHGNANERPRRFAAARGIFTAWASEQRQESRFLTPPVTRDQQANRAFAAIRSQARRGRISQDRIFELASDLNIGSDVVWKQAQNKGLQVVRG
jgi:hypothetical protein